MVSLDVDFVREQFPVFSDGESAQWAHLENAGGSYVPKHVISLLNDFFVKTLSEVKLQNDSIGYILVSEQANDIINAVKERKDFII